MDIPKHLVAKTLNKEMYLKQNAGCHYLSEKFSVVTMLKVNSFSKIFAVSSAIEHFDFLFLLFPLFSDENCLI